MGHYNMEQVDEHGVYGLITYALFYILGMITLSEGVQWIGVLVGVTTIFLNVQKFIQNRKNKKREQ